MPRVIDSSSGTPLNGVSSALNSDTGSSINNFTLGHDYVEFINVYPVNGTITGSWSSVDNPYSHLTGEGDFNGMQLVQVPEPSMLVFIVAAPAAVLGRRRLRR